MKLKYLHHSGFILQDDKYEILIDCCGLRPECGEVQRLAASGRKLYVLASHWHGDHFDSQILRLWPDNVDVTYIFSADILKNVPSSTFEDRLIKYIAKGESCREEHMTVTAFGSTDIGSSFYIEAGGVKIFHAGDLNNWHWNEEEPPEASAQSEREFLAELADICCEVKRLDALMFPIDPRLGRDYTRGAEQFLDKIPVGLFAPMHFWDDYASARAFKRKAESRGCRFAYITAPGDTFDI
ncbi:MAG: MBL fold metallo-hydrolase [Clostridiales bacterium]|jgi:L-ascorbate metabolism protein UlaG (beta-lactamase superfamily)|nr:MBL fold metallo-hydrolase [Clostridiales bacterium]